MLTERSTPVIRATLPAVGAAIEDIAGLFYRKLFAAHPDLLRDLFNRGNQANGEQRKALAGALAGFAGLLIEHPGARPDAMLARIAHKHASLGITSDQYKVVHRHLFAAMAEVLGDAFTDEATAAWDEVYWLMANALIAAEARLYQEARAAEGQVWRRMEIAERHRETPDAVSLVLRRADALPTGPFRPGQYVSVQVELADGARQIRQYSLSAAPGRAGWRITVKRVRSDAGPDGEVSSWLREHARVGDVLTVSAPFGDLVLPEGDGPLLLASAGIGATPMLAVLDHLVATGCGSAGTEAAYRACGITGCRDRRGSAGLGTGGGPPRRLDAVGERVPGRPLPARATDHHGLQLGAAGVFQRHRRPVGEVTVAPLHEHQQHRFELPAGLRGPVLEASGPLAVEDLLQHPGRHQAAQPRRQDVAGRADVADHGVEAPHPEEHLAEHEQRVLLPDHRERIGDGAGPRILHTRSVRAVRLVLKPWPKNCRPLPERAVIIPAN